MSQLHLAGSLTWPPCQVQTVLGFVLPPGAATCCLRDKPLPPGSFLLGVSAMWPLGLPRAAADTHCCGSSVTKGRVVCAAPLPHAGPAIHPVLPVSVALTCCNSVASAPCCTIILLLLAEQGCLRDLTAFSFSSFFPPRDSLRLLA